MITKYTETLRLKEITLEIMEKLKDADKEKFPLKDAKLDEMRGEVLLLRRLEEEEVRDGIDKLITDLDNPTKSFDGYQRFLDELKKLEKDVQDWDDNADYEKDEDE